MTIELQALPSADFNPRIAVLVYPGLCVFEFACVAEVFALPRPELGPAWYRFETVGLQRRSVGSQYGLEIVAQGGLDRLAAAGTVIIPGWTSIDSVVPPRLIQALKTAHRRGARLLSICSGAFVLAAAGLLDGARATTHWRYAGALQQRYPRLKVDADVLYVDNGSVLTSAGSAAGLDLCLHLVRRDFGPQIANHVARRLVIPPHRDGGQAQYIERPVQSRERDPLSRLFEYLRQNFAQPISISQMAELACMSERSLIRRFKSATGLNPGDWLIRERLERARELLESTSSSVEQIAESCGMGTAVTLRHHFRRRLGTSPGDYRRRFVGAEVDLPASAEVNRD